MLGTVEASFAFSPAGVLHMTYSHYCTANMAFSHQNRTTGRAGPGPGVRGEPACPWPGGARPGLPGPVRAPLPGGATAIAPAIGGPAWEVVQSSFLPREASHHPPAAGAAGGGRFPRGRAGLSCLQVGWPPHRYLRGLAGAPGCPRWPRPLGSKQSNLFPPAHGTHNANGSGFVFFPRYITKRFACSATTTQAR